MYPIDWNVLYILWDRVLSDFQVKEFHATDFQFGRGEFSDKKIWSEDKKKLFSASLMDVLREQGFEMFVNCVRSDEFNEAKQIAKWPGITPYEFLATFSILTVISRINEEIMKGPATVFFAKGPKKRIKSLSPDFWTKETIHGLEFREPKGIIAFQVADLLCYEFRKYFEGYTKRWPMQHLVNCGTISGKVIGPKAIEILLGSWRGLSSQ